jgi:hypothetical protein
MALALATLKAAGDKANDREAVRAQLLKTQGRDYGLYRIENGEPVFEKVIKAQAGVRGAPHPYRGSLVAEQATKGTTVSLGVARAQASAFAASLLDTVTVAGWQSASRAGRSGVPATAQLRSVAARAGVPASSEVGSASSTSARIVAQAIRPPSADSAAVAIIATRKPSLIACRS